MLPWTFVTNHARVLIFIARHPMITVQEMALKIGISERAIRRIIADLYGSGYIAKGKEGRWMRNKVNHHNRFRHNNQKEKAVAEFFKALSGGGWILQNKKGERQT